MLNWFRKHRRASASKTETADTQTSGAIEPVSDTPAGAELDEPAVNPRQFWNSGSSTNDWVAEIYNEQLKKGTFDDLPGKGKPMQVPTGDITNSILKTANYLPDWLMLQHEIRDELQKLRLNDNSLDEITIGRLLIEINIKIDKYNNMVPSAILQKRKVTHENWKQQIHHWA